MTHIPHERVEGTERCPSCAKGLSRVSSEAANICSNHRHLIHASETENPGNGVPIMLPQTEVISQPLADMFAGTSKRRAGNDEWPLAGPASEECVPGRG